MSASPDLFAERHGGLLRELCFDGGWDGWRAAARSALAAELSPDRVAWRAGGKAQGWLEGGATPGVVVERAGVRSVPRDFLALGADVACSSAPERWDVLYRVLWRLTHGERALLDVYVDDDVHALHRMAKAVRREGHKLRAFVRFRLVGEGSPHPRYVAWFEPAHDVLAREAPFFARRFPSMAWSILTPERSAHWDGTTLTFAGGVPRAEAPTGDVLEELWRTYYAHTFNPARVKPKMMRAEMPVRYWKHLPEASLIAPLLREAPGRVQRMLEQQRAAGAPPKFPVLTRADGGRNDAVAPRDDAARQTDGARVPGDAVTSRAGDPAVPADGTPQKEDGRAAPPVGEVRPREARSPHRGSTAATVSSPTVSRAAATAPHDDGIRVAHARGARARAVLAARAVAPGASPLDGCDVRVGTASWTDPTMTARGVFYPDEARDASRRLAYYASRFSLVEVDATYYALPTERVSTLWVERTPSHFVFDVKAHALMTGHATAVARLPRDLRDALPVSLARATTVHAAELPAEIVDEVWRRFVAALVPLQRAGKLGALLLQLPRRLEASAEGEREIARLRERAGALSCAVELRHASWLTGAARSARTLDLLRAHEHTFVMVDAPPGFATSMPAVAAVTNDRLAVVRMHGRRRETWESPVPVVSERYRYLYDSGELGSWVPRIIDVAQRTQGVHVVMNNCHANYGTSNADEITALLVEYDLERTRLR